MSERLIQPYEIDIDRLEAKLKPDIMSWINQAQLGGSGGLAFVSTPLPTNVAYKDTEQTFTATQWIANNGWGGKVLYGSAYYEPSEIGVPSGRLILGNVSQEEHVLGSPAFTWIDDSGGNKEIQIYGDNKRAVLRLRRNDGTFDTPSAIAAANEILGGIFSDGYLTTGFPSSSLASIQFVSGQAFTDAHGGTYIRITTTPIDSVTSASVVWIREDGKVGIGDSTPDSLLELGAASGAGYITLNEVAAPSSPATDKLAIYAKDNGSGVTKLYTKNSAGTETELGSGGSLDITGLTEDTTPDYAADFVPTYDASATGNKKVKLRNLPGAKLIDKLYPTGYEPPASNYATLDTRNAHTVLDFDGSTDEEAVWTFQLPSHYAGGGLSVDIFCSFTSATSGSVRWQAAIERMDLSSLDIDSDSFASFQSAGGSAPGTSGRIIKVTVAFTDGAQMDSLAAGELGRLKIRRDADGTSGTDDITTDAEVLAVVIRET